MVRRRRRLRRSCRLRRNRTRGWWVSLWVGRRTHSGWLLTILLLLELILSASPVPATAAAPIILSMSNPESLRSGSVFEFAKAESGLGGRRVAPAALGTGGAFGESSVRRTSLRDDLRRIIPNMAAAGAAAATAAAADVGWWVVDMCGFRVESETLCACACLM